MRKEKKKDDDEEIGTAPDGRIIVREKKKVDVDMLSSDEEDGIPENIRMSDQKVDYHMFSQKTSQNFRQQWRRQQKKILEDQRRVQSRERHVIKQEVIEQRKLEEMSRKLVSMILIVIYHLEKICSTKGKQNYPYSMKIRILSREKNRYSVEISIAGTGIPNNKTSPVLVSS